ncbi:MAG: hypothetical protein G8345_16520 [Magnetococcales bacterium]|nr:hypothetical protein [Magnetococcales bacterium]NGZ28481.1 hypothetical protein [Magnetococcales bacterium]
MAYDAGPNPHVSEEQLTYARWLEVGWKVGFLMMVLFFFLYASGIVPPHIPLNELTNYWGKPASEYLVAANLHTGWSWVYLTGKGDFLNFVGIAFLALVTSLCFLRLIPVFIAKQDKVYTILVLIETVVLALAASGILAAGH